MPHEPLTLGEVEVLVDGLSDDVSFVRLLIHLGIRGNPPSDPDPPTPDDIHDAFASIQRLVERGFARVGKSEYIDRGPPGRVAPVQHLEEQLKVVRARTEAACRAASDHHDWAHACWLVNTDQGDAAARHALEAQRTSQQE